MRKSVILLLLGSLFTWLSCIGSSWAADPKPLLEPTDSGAPSAILIFPVGEKPNPNTVAMPPVSFNHVIHEKWAARHDKDCVICHHSGDPDACTSCHTLEGKKEGNFITLQKAMHAVEITVQAKNMPSSCVSCHEKTIRKKKDCAGCHLRLVKNPDQTSAWCRVCHTVTPSMTVTQMQEGIQNKLPDEQNEALATETAVERVQADYWSPMVGPYKVYIDSLKGQYEPCFFNHRHHVSSLLDRIAKNELASAFHTEPATICVTCHHHAPPTARPSRCISCHNKAIDWTQPGRPALKGAYHLLCMSCHTDMKVGRPRNTDCETCHKLSPVAAVTR